MLVGPACGLADGGYVADTGMPEPVPPNCDQPTQGDTESCPAGGSGGVGSDCRATVDCDGGLVCGAAFDGEIGRFSCQSACIEDQDEQRWCLDDRACCSAGSVCSPRGYCLPGTADDTSTASGTADGPSTGAADTAATTVGDGAGTSSSTGTTGSTTAGSTGA